jgi:hypothetical protein
MNELESSSRLIAHGAATLYTSYLERHVAGDEWDDNHKGPTKEIALSWLLVLSGTREIASAEALFSVYSAFFPEQEIDNYDGLRAVLATGLVVGSEFILKDVLQNPIPQKSEFLELLRTKHCYGVGVRLGVPKSAFDGSGERGFSEHIGKPSYARTAQGVQMKGHITPEYLLRIAAGWGCLDAVKALRQQYTADINAQDSFGETALLKACRAGNTEVVKWLTQTGKAKANIGTRKGITPLHWLNSFGGDVVDSIAQLLKRAGGGANAIAVENAEDWVESRFYFFKGPPLMRVVASGNLAAVNALLRIGADPMQCLDGSTENPIIFAARRLRLNVLKALLHETGDSEYWHMSGRGCLMRHIIECHPTYGVKIHGKDFFQAQLETFDFAWSKCDPTSRLFRSITSSGEIAIQVAVKAGQLALTKRIVESCPEAGHLKELLVTIGLQCAVLRGRTGIFTYLLSQGAQPLHPVLVTVPGEAQQFQDYVLYGPWTMDLAPHQRKTTSLHLCSKGGDASASLVRPC